MQYKRIVIKLGTNLITGGSGGLDLGVMATLAGQVAELHRKGHEIILVSSGAVAAGREMLGIKNKLKDIPFKQVMASVGQNRLMNIYYGLFLEHGINVAQALLTRSDLTDRAHYLNARNTLLALIGLKVVCIVNENDVVCTDELGELKFGDNDNLSAMVANLVDADLLILLSDVKGLYTADPQNDPGAKLIPVVEKIDGKIEDMAGRRRQRARNGRHANQDRGCAAGHFFGCARYHYQRLSTRCDYGCSLRQERRDIFHSARQQDREPPALAYFGTVQRGQADYR